LIQLGHAAVPEPVKRDEDQILGALCLMLFAPLVALIAVAIRLDSKGPVFFLQDRFGFNNKTIRVFKFRTMHVDKCDQTGTMRTVAGDRRVTRIGRFLRKFSLDELPQLINVIARTAIWGKTMRCSAVCADNDAASMMNAGALA
jgi:polysaccharide biosynthesis protein PslA